MNLLHQMTNVIAFQNALGASESLKSDWLLRNQESVNHTLVRK